MKINTWYTLDDGVGFAGEYTYQNSEQMNAKIAKILESGIEKKFKVTGLDTRGYVNSVMVLTESGERMYHAQTILEERRLSAIISDREFKHFIKCPPPESNEEPKEYMVCVRSDSVASLWNQGELLTKERASEVAIELLKNRPETKVSIVKSVFAVVQEIQTKVVDL